MTRRRPDVIVREGRRAPRRVRVRSAVRRIDERGGHLARESPTRPRARHLWMARRRVRDDARGWTAPGNGRLIDGSEIRESPRDDDFVWASDRSRKPSRGSTRRAWHTRARPGFMLAAALRRLSQAQSSTSLGAGAAIFADATRASAFAPTRPPAGSHAAARASRIVASRALLRPHRRRVHITSASAAWTRAEKGFARVDDPRASPADRAPRAPRAVSGRRPDRSAPAPRPATALAPPRAEGRKGGKAAALPDDASNGKGPGSRAYVQVIGLGTDTDGDTSRPSSSSPTTDATSGTSARDPSDSRWNTASTCEGSRTSSSPACVDTPAEDSPACSSPWRTASRSTARTSRSCTSTDRRGCSVSWVRLNG